AQLVFVVQVQAWIGQVVVAGVGTWSLTISLRAIPVPLLVTETVNPMASPAETEALSADLATSMAAPRTSTEAEAVSDPSLVVVTLADRKSTRLNSSHVEISYAVCCLKKKTPARSEGPQLRVRPAM